MKIEPWMFTARMCNVHASGDAIMIDLETYSTGAMPHILSIGAVAWNRGYATKGVSGAFHEVLARNQYGASLQDATLRRWQERANSEAAVYIMKARREAAPRAEVLGRFRDWFNMCNASSIWAYGRGLNWLGAAYELESMAPPWTYRQENDLQTLANETEGAYALRPIEDEHAHGALSDAWNQAVWLDLITGESGCRNIVTLP